jgi:Ser/Thr protein kinase RdoA (MazF antagonist)
MDKEIREKFSKEILEKICPHFSTTVDEIKFIGGFQSFVYEFKYGGKSAILRISHSSHRTANEICGEIDWINFLANSGIPAARGLPSDTGSFVVVVDNNNESFIGSAFIKAKGEHVKPDDWNHPMFSKMGSLMGKMHSLTCIYHPTRAIWKRKDWYAECKDFVRNILPTSEKPIIDKFDSILDQIRQLPTPENAYGLIHADFHRGNFYYHKNQITLFDFDDCQYSWFIDDIAMAIFYATPMIAPEQERIEFAQDFILQFQEGYDKEHQLDTKWFSYIPLFHKIREIGIYSALYAAGITEGSQDWSDHKFMHGRKDRILNDIPFLDMDFENMQ